MPRFSLSHLRDRLKRREAKPLVTSDHDLKLLRRAHGRRLPTLSQLRHLPRLLSAREQVVFRASLGVLLVSLVWFGLGLADRYRVQVPAIGGKYVEAIVGTPELINPVFASINDVDLDITRLVYSGLLRVDKRQRIVPDIAASYTVSEDNRTYTFTMREDVVWHDGEPLTADDVVYTIETIQNPAVGSPLQVSFTDVVVEATDTYTVQFTLTEPFPAFLSTLTVGILPEHLWIDVAAERMRLTGRNLQPVGSGPYQFDSLVKDDTGLISQYRLKRFEQYYRSVPYIEEFVFQFFAQYDGDLGAIQALRQQAVDGLHFVPNDLIEKATRNHIQLHTLQLPQYTALFFNQDRQRALEDLDTRQALAFALDKERILRETLRGEGQVIYSPILPGFPGYAPEIEKTPYSIEEANALLDEEWDRFSQDEYRELRRSELTTQIVDSRVSTSTEDGTDTASSEDEEPQLTPEEQELIELTLAGEINEAQTFYRKNDNEEILVLRLVTTDTQEYRSAAERVAGFWQELGIRTELSYVDPRDLSREVLKGRKYDVLLYGVILGSDPDQYPFWHSSQIDFPGLNLARYVNRSADTLLEEAREATDEESAITAYESFQDLVLAEQPAIFLYMPTYTYATNEDILGVDVTRIFNPSDRFADVASWYIKTDGQWNFSGDKTQQ